ASCGAPRVRTNPTIPVARRLTSGPVSGSGGYHRRRHALASADTHREQRAPAAAAVEFVQRRGQHADTGGSDRMAEGYPGTVDIQPVPVVPAPAAEHAQDLAGEGLVEFDQVVVGEAVPG